MHEKRAILGCTLHLSSKSRQTKKTPSEAQFGFVLNWAFVAQRGGGAEMVEVKDVIIKEGGNIFSGRQTEVKKEFRLHPAIQCFDNRVIRWSSPSRHGTKYVIMSVGLSKSLGRVDSSLVGVEDYRGRLLFSFVYQLFQNVKTMVVGLVASGDGCDAVGQDLVVEGIHQDRPLPGCMTDLEHGHVRNHDLQRGRGIPVPIDYIGKLLAFLPGRIVMISFCF